MDLQDIYRPLRKWWWLLLLATAVAGITSFIVTQVQPNYYRTRTTLIVGGGTIDDPNPNSSQLYLSQQLANIYADIGKREPVKIAAMETLGMTWLPDYYVASLNNTQLVEIVVEDIDPLRTQVVANELARQVILQGPAASDADEQERLRFVNQQLDSLEAQVAETELELEQKQIQLGEEFSARKIAELRTEISILEGKLRDLQTNYSTLLGNSREGAANTISILETAQLPIYPVGPNLSKNVLVAATIGLALAAAAAYLLEYLDDTIRTSREITNASGLTVLTAIADRKMLGDNDPLVVRSNPRSPIAESYRSLRTAIQFNITGSSGCKSILVTSANPGEGKSVTAANLALVLAQGGHRVLLIDADLRRPTQHKLFNIGMHPGLTAFVFDVGKHRNGSAESALSELALRTTQPGLHLLPAGYISPNPSEVLGSKRMSEAIELASSLYDYIIFDSPPVLAVTDPVVIATQVDAVILAVFAGRTRLPQFKHMLARLEEVNANVLGVVLNRITNDSETYQYYYSQSVYTIEEQGALEFRGTGRETQRRN